MSARPGWRLLAETGIDLVIASLHLRIRRFERVVRRQAGTAGAAPIASDEAAMLARALKAWDRRLPWRTQCFEQGLAAAAYLRRRGLAATLHYGARGQNEQLQAHVWVMSGDVPVVGCENAADYRELARYPAD